MTIRQRGVFREAYVYTPFGIRVLVGKSVVPEEASLRNLALPRSVETFPSRRLTPGILRPVLNGLNEKVQGGNSENQNQTAGHFAAAQPKLRAHHQGVA